LRREAAVRRYFVVVALVVGLLVASAGSAHAWDLIHSRSGHGRVTLRAWTRGYGQVAFLADHAHTRVSVDISVDCRDGYTFADSWTDGGAHFRFILRGLRDHGRCNHLFRVVANDPEPQLDLYVFAR
jgi:hypothetical protein